MPTNSEPLRGRGTGVNPPNRFELLQYEVDSEAHDSEAPGPKTQIFKDSSRSLITYNDSPDVGFEASVNPYRGCEHGCVYCYARPYHEYLGFSAGLDFETKIMAKEDAPALLRKELSSPKWRPQTLALSGVTDCYQPIERHLRITRRCLEVMVEFGNPVSVITKNHLVARDRDLLGTLAAQNAAAVFLSITTLDGNLARIMEPRTSHPEGRLAALRELSAAGVPVGVMAAPIIPGLNDHEIPAILEAAARAGATFASYTVLRLPYAVLGLFENWLTQQLPEKKDRVLGRIRDLRGGKLNESRFGVRMKGEGILAEAIKKLFVLGRQKAGLAKKGPQLSTAGFKRPGGEQKNLFD